MNWTTLVGSFKGYRNLTVEEALQRQYDELPLAC